MASHKLLGAKIDYLTFTIREQNPDFQYLISMWEREIADECDAEYPMCFESRNSYYGPRSRHWHYGQRHDGYQFQVTSAQAHKAVEILKEMQFILKVTRLDVRADVLHPKQLGDFHLSHQKAVRRNEKKAGCTQPKTIRLVDSPTKGNSITIGNKKGGEQNCGYDKDAEQGFRLGKPIKRNESRFGRDRAPKVWHDILKCSDLEQLCLDIVVAKWKADGIKLPIAKNAKPYDIPTAYKPPSPEEVTAQWLIACASKAFRKLKNETLRKAVADAFGLGYKPLPAPVVNLSEGAREAFWALEQKREDENAGNRYQRVKESYDL